MNIRKKAWASLRRVNSAGELISLVQLEVQVSGASGEDCARLARAILEIANAYVTEGTVERTDPTFNAPSSPAPVAKSS